MAVYDSSTALVVVDMQNDFVDPHGSLTVRQGGEVLTVVNREITKALDAGALVVFTQDWHPPTTPHFAKDGGVWPVHCVRDTWGADFVPGLHVAGPVVRKGVGGEDGYSAFSVRHPQTGATRATDLADLLRERFVTRIVIVGLATDYCVKETALDAIKQGLAATVLSEGVRPVDREPGDGDRALQVMAEAGVTIE